MKAAVDIAGERLLRGKRFELQLETIEIVTVEGGDEDAAHLIEIGGYFEFLDRAAHRKIVDDDLALVNGALRHPA